MASWGRKADELLTGTGSIDANTNIVTGANTVFTEEVELRNLISLDDTIFVVTSINSDEELEVLPVAEAGLTDEDILLSEAPKYLPVSEINNVVYVATGDIDANTRADGIKTPGWTLYEEYGTGRKRVETLVAMKSTS
jgi:hypothetical protein